MDEDEFDEESEFTDGEISRTSSLTALEAVYSHAYVSSLNHSHVIAAITDCECCFTQFLLNELCDLSLLEGTQSTSNECTCLQSNRDECFYQPRVFEDLRENGSLHDEDKGGSIGCVNVEEGAAEVVCGYFDESVKRFEESGEVSGVSGCFCAVSREDPNFNVGP